MIVGIVGRTYAPNGSCSAGTGKDTVADALVREFNMVKMGIADTLKRFLFDLGYTKEQLWGPSHRRTESSPKVGGVTARHALKTLGTEWGRELMYEGIWVDRALRDAKEIMGCPGHTMYVQEEGVVGRTELCPQGEFERDDVPEGDIQGVVFSDVRFRNELDAIRKAGGVLILVKRTLQYGISASVDRDHPSELELADVRDDEFHFVINNDGTLKELLADARSCIIRHRGSTPSPDGSNAVRVAAVLDSRLVEEGNPLKPLLKQREADVRAGRIVTPVKDFDSDIPPFMRRG